MLSNSPHFLTAMKNKPKNFYHLLDTKLEDAGAFSDGALAGYIAFYDLEAARPTPLTGETLASFVAAILADPAHDEQYRQGFLLGWSAGLGESRPDYFFLEVRSAGKDEK